MFAVTRDDFVPLDSTPLFSCGVYLLVSADGNIVYIGQTGSFELRMKDHARTKKWWGDVDQVLCYPCANSDLRLTLEAALILRYRPRHNRAVKIALKADGGIYEIQFVRSSGYHKGKKKSSG